MGKGFQVFFNEIDADFFCLQETKLQACLHCHNLFDNSPQRRDIKDRLTGYLSWRYGDNWITDEDELKYHKGMDYEIKQYEYQGGTE